MFRRRLVGALAIVAALSIQLVAPGRGDDPGRGGGHSAMGGSGHVGFAGGPRMAAPAVGILRGGHFTAPNGAWAAHPAWRGDGEFVHWRAGHWWRGTYGGRYGWWWIVGPDWYWYSTEIEPFPPPQIPPGMAPGYWYWCDAYQAYYPYVGACPSGWQAVTPQ